MRRNNRLPPKPTADASADTAAPKAQPRALPEPMDEEERRRRFIRPVRDDQRFYPFRETRQEQS